MTEFGDPDYPQAFKLLGGPFDGATLPSAGFGTGWPDIIVIGTRHAEIHEYRMEIGVLDEYRHVGTSQDRNSV